MYRICWLFAIALGLLPGPAAAATVQGNVVIAKWKRMDLCAQQAQTEHPAFTAAENAAREAALKRCLESRNLPPRQPLPQPPPH